MPSPGDWVGITFKGTPSADNRIEHTTIAYAGGVSGISSYDCGLSGDSFSNESAVVFYGQRPASVFLTSSRIEHSARDGVVRGWVGDPLDFTASNTFVGVARCLQTFPQPLNDSCPTDPPCPKSSTSAGNASIAHITERMLSPFQSPTIMNTCGCSGTSALSRSRSPDAGLLDHEAKPSAQVLRGLRVEHKLRVNLAGRSVGEGIHPPRS